jgi:hypothetical protein
MTSKGCGGLICLLLTVSCLVIFSEIHRYKKGKSDNDLNLILTNRTVGAIGTSVNQSFTVHTSISISTTTTTTITPPPTRYAILVISQSNAISASTDPYISPQDDPIDGIYTVYTGCPFTSKYWNNDNGNGKNLTFGDVMVAQNPLPFLGPIMSSTPTSNSFSFHLAKRLKEKYVNDTFWILNGAYSGSSLQNSSTGTWYPPPYDDLDAYPDMDLVNVSSNMNHYIYAMRYWKYAIEKYDLTPLVLLCVGGESDIELDSKLFQLTANSNYIQDFDYLLERIRRGIGDLYLPVLVGTILENLYHWPNVGGEVVEEAHRNIATRLNHSYTVDLYELSSADYVEQSRYMQLELRNSTSENPVFQPLHFNAAGERKMGELFYQVFEKCCFNENK